jgi:hypothetical protein
MYTQDFVATKSQESIARAVIPKRAKMNPALAIMRPDLEYRV